ncbi:uncharacterized protein LOC125655922 isoform X2 [Ostrea edulis]|uniref:uncharacterized protein LOC125655922 isoform X2 n=1 Tax=Ostrea edulis TaxID=37623 RepID=UPI0024AFD396|nr:uncharacterized protein LOC125655922 isoform X2 [Ostrea edulis]
MTSNYLNVFGFVNEEIKRNARQGSCDFKYAAKTKTEDFRWSFIISAAPHRRKPRLKYITTSWEHVSKSRVNVENSMESTTAAYVTTSSEQMSTHRVNRKKSTDINTGTQPKTGTSTSNPITLTSTALTEYGVTRQLDTHDSTGDTVVLSFAVGLFSFLVGMLVMLLLYRGNKSRMKFARKRQDRRISVFLINNARQYTSRENLNAELPIRYQSIQSLNTPNAQIPNTYQNSEEAGIPYLNSDRDDIQTVSSNICRQEISSVFGTTLNQEDCNSGEYMELNDI